MFLIDEPEISLHLHWQMEFHKTLTALLQGLQKFHVVVATHAPVIISEAARWDPNRRLNGVVVLRRDDLEHAVRGQEAPGERAVKFTFHTLDEVASHEQLFLRYFQTAPYHAREVSVELADAVLGVAEGQSDIKAKALLNEIRSAEGLSPEAIAQIDSALDLIERGLVISIKRQERT